MGYDAEDKLSDMLDLTHLNISHFDWDLEETSRRMNENRRKGVSLMDGFEDFYTFGNLKPDDQLRVVDEFISNFFANNRD
ncbi:MAG TPA: hypothetical protein VJH22_04580, partial [Candidatus Nanoarchaeia archaeon]|nr:hypothetical protein [Candidatus Nanoarchaeia archaeon]